VVLLIRVVNLVIERLSTTNDDFCDLRVWQPDVVLSGCHFVLQMTTGLQNVNRMGVTSGCHLQNKMTTGWHSRSF